MAYDHKIDYESKLTLNNILDLLEPSDLTYDIIKNIINGNPNNMQVRVFDWELAIDIIKEFHRTDKILSAMKSEVYITFEKDYNYRSLIAMCNEAVIRRCINSSTYDRPCINIYSALEDREYKIECWRPVDLAPEKWVKSQWGWPNLNEPISFSKI